MDRPRIIDISPTISEKLAVFPGDTPFRSERLLEIKKGHNIDLSTIHGTVHLGAHTDAPNHYHKDGVGIDQVDLNTYFGPAQVIQVELKAGGRITDRSIKDIDISAPRVLFKTNSYPDPDQWNSDFMALSPELIEYLSSKNVILVGIDTPSVDLAEDKILNTHLAIYQKKMAILEGIVLTDVEEGDYQLVALPLKIKGCDASPVRAVLIS